MGVQSPVVLHAWTTTCETVADLQRWTLPLTRMLGIGKVFKMVGLFLFVVVVFCLGRVGWGGGYKNVFSGIGFQGFGAGA